MAARIHPSEINGYAVIPMLTPFKEDGALDGASISRMVRYILEGGCQGIMISGTTGEAVSMDREMRLQLVDATLDSMDDRGTLLFGIGHNCFEQSVHLAKAALAKGCHGVVAHLPAYYDLNSNQIESWFTALADQVGGPMFVYNIPQTTKVSIPIDVLERISYHPNIIGLKDSERDEDRQLQLAGMFNEREDFAFLTGYIGMGDQIMKAGARGFVPAVGNFCPALAREMMDAHLSRDYSSFKPLLERMMQISTVFQGHRTVAEALSAMKATASILELCEPYVLPPLRTANDSEILELRSALKDLNLISA